MGGATLTVRGEGRPREMVVDRHAFRPHMRVRPRQRGDAGTLEVTVQARRGELVLPLALSSLLIAAVLALLPMRAHHVDGQALVALLLVPFALSTFYIRSHENSYVTRMLRGVRSVALVSLGAAAWAIGLVAFGVLPLDGPPDVGTLWLLRGPFLVAVWPAALLALACAMPWLAELLRRPTDRFVEWGRRGGVRKAIAVGLVAFSVVFRLGLVHRG